MTDGNPIDFPNLFVMSCPSDQKPFVTLHFPEKYVFNGFSSDTWLPNTKLAVRVPSGTFSFDAELNRNEFFVDLGESEFDYLQDIWSADGRVDLKVGPAMSDVTLVFAPVGRGIGWRHSANVSRVIERHTIRVDERVIRHVDRDGDVP
jgi:hypothetical protein